MASYTSYLSNILTHTTSRYNSLRKILLNNEDDGDTEDDSHISRVLRAYYTEKGTPFPPWLPPDPNARRAITPQPALQQQNSYFNNARNPYGNQPAATPGRGGILNDLWDAPAQQAPAQPQSLRAGRRQPAAARQEPAASSLAIPQARPLPSQRSGSYQSQSLSPGYQADTTPSPGGGTAQDRLKARLWGRNGSGNLPPPQAQSNSYQQDSRNSNSYQQDPRNSGGDRRYGRI